MYLSHTAQWTHQGDERAVHALRLIAADQESLAGRIAVYLVEHYGRADTGGYPMAFTALHDLSLDYLLRHLAENQRKEIAVFERLADELRDHPAGRAFAQEALGAAKGHLETFEELAASVK
jgi:hypothetical protein